MTQQNSRQTLFTIGYQEVPFDDFIMALESCRIEVLVDVRRRAQAVKREYAEAVLRLVLEARGIRYLHIPALGPTPEVRAAWWAGVIDTPELLMAYRFYLDDAEEEVDALMTLACVNRCCLLGPSNDPNKCHRSVLATVIAERSDDRIEVRHL